MSRGGRGLGDEGGHPRECVQRSGHTYLWVGNYETLSHVEHPCPSPPCFRETLALGVGSVFDPETEWDEVQGAQRFRVDMPSEWDSNKVSRFSAPQCAPDSLLLVSFILSPWLSQFEISGQKIICALDSLDKAAVCHRGLPVGVTLSGIRTILNVS